MDTNGQHEPLPGLDDNHSFWAASMPDYQPNLPLKKNTQADLAIIGGGFTGVSTAYHFSRRYPEKRVLLLEAKALANGASGRYGGQLLNWIYGAPTDDASHQRIFQVTKAAIDQIEAIIKEHNLPVSFRRDGILRVYTSPGRAAKAQAEVEHLQTLGLPIRYLDRAPLKTHIELCGVYGASYDPTEGMLNGVQYLRHLKPVLVEQGVEVYENTPVLKITEERTITLETPQAIVRAQAIVLATNAYTMRLGYFRHAFFPVLPHMYAATPRNPQHSEAVGWNNTAGFSDDYTELTYAVRVPEGPIVLGGTPYGNHFGSNRCTMRRVNDQATQKRFKDMEAVANGYLPTLRDFQITHRWAGAVALSLRQLSGSFGVRGDHRNVYYGLAYNGHGGTLANLAGQVLTDLYSGDDQQWRGLPFYQPRHIPLPPDPLRCLGTRLVVRLLPRYRPEGWMG